MIDYLRNAWAALTWVELLIGLGLVVVTFVASYLIVSVILIRLPADYFRSDYEYHMLPDKHPVLRSAAIGAKNVLGVLLILTGIVLSLPGVPGPGILTIFIGIMLTDIPGKKRLEARIIARPAIRSTIDGLRARHNRPPLEIDT